MPTQPALSIVIPAFGEQDLIVRVVEAVREQAARLALDTEIIVVDDGSEDATWPALQRLCAQHPEVGALRLSRNFGKESAVAAGLDEARGDGVLVMDGDMQHPPELIPAMVEAWRGQGAHIVEAVKEDRGREGLLQRAGARLFYASWSWLAGYDLRGATDYKLLDRRVVEEWRRLGERNLFFRGMVAWLGFKRVQVAFSVPERGAGASKFRFSQLLRLALTATTAFSTLPLRLVTLLGGLSLVLAVVLGARALWLWVRGEAVSGFTTVILLQLILGSAVLIGLGVIGEYVARTYQETKRRPRYVAMERCGRPRDA